MDLWFLIVVGTAAGGALLVWHAVSRTKHVAEEMLSQYREMLAKARAKKSEELAKAEVAERAETEVVTTAAPADAGETAD